MQHLIPDTQEWATAWALLAEHPLNSGLPDSRTAANSDEVWEYMGTADGKHTFRHRCHPTTSKREYLHFPVSCGVAV